MSKDDRAGRSLRLFDLLLRLLVVLLTIVTGVSVAFGAAMVFGGSGSLAVDAKVEPPYSVEFGGASVEVDASGDGRFDYGDVPGSSILTEVVVGAQIFVGADDRDTRLVVAAAGLAWLALAWLGLVNLRRVVGSARRGDPFDARNVVRLRWMAGAVLGFPVVATAMTQSVETTLDLSPPVEVTSWGPSWWLFLLIGLGLLALAEVFRAGSELRELERSTI
jgi:hypothetical protein